jgi:hypothetical protein
MINEFDFGYPVNPGAGLSELFGVVRKYHIGSTGSFRVTITNNSLLDGLDTGDFFNGVYFRDEWNVLEGAGTIARYEDGSPAMVMNQFGEGYTIMSGVPLGASYLRDNKNPVNRIIAGIALHAGATPDVITRPKENNKPSVYHHRYGDVSFVYLINSSEESYEGGISLNREEEPAEVRNIIDEQVYPFKFLENRISLDISIPAKGVYVSRIN